MSDFAWREMRPDDVDSVVAVAAACFPHHFEAQACFEERLTLFPQGCFVLGSGRETPGYLIAYPHPIGTVPALNSLLGNLNSRSQSFYLHDLALHPNVRGGGFARPIVDRLVDLARASRGSAIHLVAVNGSAPFWLRMGFVPASANPQITRKLETYGADAAYMVRKL